MTAPPVPLQAAARPPRRQEWLRQYPIPGVREWSSPPQPRAPSPTDRGGRRASVPLRAWDVLSSRTGIYETAEEAEVVSAASTAWRMLTRWSGRLVSWAKRWLMAARV